MDDLLLGYALDALDPADTAAVEARLRDDPTAAARLAHFRRALAPLAADRDGYDPPPGLAAATLARVAGLDVPAAAPAQGPPVVPKAPSWPAAPADVPIFHLRRRVEVAVAACVAVLAFGLVLGGVQKVRRDSQLAACQNNLRVLYQGLSGYADDHADRFPQVGGPDTPTAGAFVSTLVEAGQYPADLSIVCPATPDPDPAAAGFRPGPALAPPGPEVVARVGYAYTLGYRGPGGGLVGPWRGGPAGDRTPLAADLPAPRVAPSDGPVSPHGGGQNVLFADGRVQFFTQATVGPAGDDIYRNDAGRVRAGLHPLDASLGRATDVP